MSTPTTPAPRPVNRPFNKTPDRPKKNGVQQSSSTYMTHCKLGKHRMAQGDPYVWLQAPLGISCVECASKRGKGES